MASSLPSSSLISASKFISQSSSVPPICTTFPSPVPGGTKLICPADGQPSEHALFVPIPAKVSSASTSSPSITAPSAVLHAPVPVASTNSVLQVQNAANNTILLSNAVAPDPKPVAPATPKPIAPDPNAAFSSAGILLSNASAPIAESFPDHFSVPHNLMQKGTPSSVPITLHAASSSSALSLGNTGIILLESALPPTPTLAKTFFLKPIITKPENSLVLSPDSQKIELLPSFNSVISRNFTSISTPSSPTILLPENPLKIHSREDSFQFATGMYAQYQCVSDVEDYDNQCQDNLIQDFEDFKDNRNSLINPVPITPVNLKKRRTRKPTDRTVITRQAAKADNQSLL